MIVDKKFTKVINREHSIEFGQSSWDNSVDSVRRRKNSATGRFDPYSSSEIPINGGYIDIGMVVCECLKIDKISHKDMIDLFKELTESFKRQGFAIPIP